MSSLAPQRLWRRALLLGPAFVAAVAYVDPGNVAANLTAGARYHYQLVWVLVAASIIAVLVQYLSAKLGIVTGRTLPDLAGERLAAHGRWWRTGYGVQALIMAMATDIAEVIGGAIGLNLLFNIPIWLGSLVVGVAAIVLLRALRVRGEAPFEAGVTVVLTLVAFGFIGSLYWAHPDWGQAAAGLRPQLSADAAPLAGAMLGATVMPHAIYLHSILARDRHRAPGTVHQPTSKLLVIQRWDVLLSLALAGSVNIAMLLAAAATLHGTSGDSIEVAHRVITDTVSPLAGVVFGLGLLASGLGSAVVGTHAGAGVMKELLPGHLDHGVRRIITIVPAVLLPLSGVDATFALVVSQLVLSFGIAFALIPLVLLTRDQALMGLWRNRLPLHLAAWIAVVVVVALNVWLLIP